MAMADVGGFRMRCLYAFTMRADRFANFASGNGNFAVRLQSG
jgi:hypothetical protein